MTFVVVTTTVGNKAKAETLAAMVVGKRLAACVQYMPITSIYRWKGRVETAKEHLLMAKSTAEKADALISLIRDNHAYELPEITVMPITGGLGKYLNWIDEETAAPARKRRPTGRLKKLPMARNS